MKNNINIAVIGLGQVGIYLLNELNTKKKEIELKTGKTINVVAVSAKNINKKRRFKVNKKIFYKNPLEIFNKTKVDILFEAIGMSDGITKKVVETALKNKIHVITPNKALISKHGDYLGKLAEDKISTLVLLKISNGFLKNIFLLTLNLLFLEMLLAETATTLIFLPVLS